VNKWSNLKLKAKRLRKEAEECEKKTAELQKEFPFLGNVVGEVRRGLKSKKEAPVDTMEVEPVVEGKGKKRAAPEEKTLKGREFLEKKLKREAGLVSKAAKQELTEKIRAEKAGKFTELE
jgi:hypothetical protein